MTAITKQYVRNNAVNYLLSSFTLEKKGAQGIDTVQFSLSRDHVDLFEIGDDVAIGYDSGGFVTLYTGDIVLKSSNEQLMCTMESYGGRLNREIVTELYDGQTPEYIAENLITTYFPAFTYASTTASGITITRFTIRNESVAEALSRLVELTGWQFRVDNSKNFYFEPMGNPSATVALTVDSNCWLEGDWKSNPNQLINSVSFIGGYATFNKYDTFDGDTSTVQFTLGEKPIGNVRVIVDDVEQVGGQDGSTTTYDYTFDDENKQINFIVGSTPGTGTDNVEVYYEYQVPIKIDANNDVSIAAYTKFPKKFTNKSVVTMADARKFVSTVLETYGTPSSGAVLNVKYGLDVDVGQNVYVTDVFNSVEKAFVINKLTIKYPEGTKSIEVGLPKLEMLDWNTSVDQRLKKLEQAQDSSDTVQKYLSFKENIIVFQKQGRVRVRTDTLGHSWICGSSTNGLVGTNTATEDGSQQVVGGAGRVQAVVRVVNHNNTMIEDFQFNNFEDTGSTTADWNDTGDVCSFTTGEVAQSLAVYLDSTTISTATMTVEDGTNLTGQLSADGGSNWENITFGTKHTFTNTGTDLRFKLTASDTASTEWVKVTYNM